MFNDISAMDAVICIAIVLTVLSVIYLIFFSHNNPFSTIAWFIGILFIPFVGLAFYLFFGIGVKVNTRRIIRKKVRSDKEIANAYEEYEEKNKNYMSALCRGEIPLNDSCAENYLSHISMQYHMGGSLFSQNNDATIYTDVTEHYEALLTDIKAAKSSINLLYFIFNNDEIGNRITDALTEKAKEGVEVRLCLDAIGSFANDILMFRPLKKAGGKVSLFNIYYLFNLFNINYRNHRKIVVIDGVIGYVGGANIGDEYMGFHKKITPWRDTHMRITGEAVLGLQEEFVKDWYSASKEKAVFTEKYRELFFKHTETKASHGTVGMQIISGGPDSNTEQIKRAIIKMIASAKYKGGMSNIAHKMIREFFDKFNIDKNEVYLTDSYQLSKDLRADIEKQVMELGVKNVVWLKLGGVITAHSGPGAIGIAGMEL